MTKQPKIPLLNPLEQHRHHFGEEQRWSSNFEPGFQQFHLNRVEAAAGFLHFPLPPHRKTTFDFIFLTAGSSKRSKGLNDYIFNAGSFFFLPARQITSHEYYTPEAKGFFCQFDGDLLNSAYVDRDRVGDFPFLQFTGNPLVEVLPENRQPVLNILERLEAIYHQEHPDRLDLLRLYLLALFTELRRFANAAEKPPVFATARIAQQFKNALSHHIYEKQSVAEYASLLSVSTNHLNKCVKSATGKTAQDLLNDMLLLEAKVLLLQTDLPLGEIAFKIKQQDASNFGRFFKSKTGVTPQAYRKVE